MAEIISNGWLWFFAISGISCWAAVIAICVFLIFMRATEGSEPVKPTESSQSYGGTE